MTRMTRTTQQGRRALAAACGSRSRCVPARPPTRASATSTRASTATAIALPTSASRDGRRAVRGAWPRGRRARRWPPAGSTAARAQEAVVAQLTPAGAPDAAFGTGGVARIPSTGFVTRLHGVALDGRRAGARRRRPAPRRRRRPTASPALLPRSTPTARPTPAFADRRRTVGEARAVAPLADGRHAGRRLATTVGRRRSDVFFVARLIANGRARPRRSAAATASRDVAFGAGVARGARRWRSTPAGGIVLAGWAFAGAHRARRSRAFDAGGTTARQRRSRRSVTDPSGQTGGLLDDVAGRRRRADHRGRASPARLRARRSAPGRRRSLDPALRHRRRDLRRGRRVRRRSTGSRSTATAPSWPARPARAAARSSSCSASLDARRRRRSRPRRRAAGLARRSRSALAAALGVALGPGGTVVHRRRARHADRRVRRPPPPPTPRRSPRSPRRPGRRGRAGDVRRRRLERPRGRGAALRVRPRRRRLATSSTAARTRSRCAASPRPGPTPSACA